MPGLSGIRLYERYDRRGIADFLGVKYSRYWEQGVVRADSNYLLFVTLDKSGSPAELRYDDRFLSPSDLQWQSQNQESRATRGAKYMNRGAQDLQFHLFVRRSPRDPNNQAARFVYLGQVRFHSWEGDNPINIHWRLDDPVPGNLRAELEIPP